ncbi:MAG TPA: type VI secretion system ImpA family N-terminal domain-containing protein [Longimicrobium sp.]|jgi:type VI secretion system protein ImpA|uniref:type VI secretion system protein TssA n=1 Tax=Longimicrobium sp. TaxID=2029185 RepID=UPI002ED984B8
MSDVALHAAAPGTAVDELARRVLAPAPGRADLRADGTWARIQEALRDEDSTVPRGIWERPLKRADPRHAAALAVKALQTGGGDLQVAGWLTQAWVMIHGFSGASHGLRLVHALSGGGALEGDPEVLERPFAWMAKHLPRVLGRVELTGARAGAAGFTWEAWQAALYRDRAQRAAGERPAPDDATPDDVLQAATRTPTAFYVRVERELADTAAAVDALQQLLRERWAGPPPSLQPLHRTVAEIHGWVAAQLAERPAEPDPLDTDDEPLLHEDPEHPGFTDAYEADPDEEETYEPLVPEYGAAIRGRAEAYAALAAAADYLARTEPHSPAPWLVRRAVGWGGMHLGELLGALIDEGYDLKTLRSLLGLAAEGRP